MATRRLLAELVQSYGQSRGATVELVSIGGVDAAKRVEQGEDFDLVVLASDAIERLGPHLVPGQRLDWVDSAVGAAVPLGADKPDISSAAALRRAIEAAPSIACSTGPSGRALGKIFAGWGLEEVVAKKSVQPPPGTPVAKLLAEGQAALGFQQMSELMEGTGIELLGALPAEVGILTLFSAAICRRGLQAEAAKDFMRFLAEPAHAELVRRHGMDLHSQKESLR